MFPSSPDRRQKIDAAKKLADAYAGIFRAFLKHRDSVKMVSSGA